jgi:MYXO-CTERM domain-containing protein
MIAPPTFNCVLKARLLRALGAFLLWVLALLAVPSALAGDRGEPDTAIVTGPDAVTSASTADFTFRSTATRAAFFCQLDDGADFLPCETPWHLEGLAPGSHALRVYSLDLDIERADPEPALWEWEVVEDGPPLDAGSPDGGAPDNDAGPGGQDGGSTGDEDAGPAGGEDGGPPGEVDAGTSGGDDAGPGDPEDAGTPGGGTDAGDAGDAGDAPPGPPPPDGNAPPDALDYLGGGVGCTGAPAPGAVAGLLLLVLALHRRRRP